VTFFAAIYFVVGQRTGPATAHADAAESMVHMHGPPLAPHLQMPGLALIADIHPHDHFALPIGSLAHGLALPLVMGLEATAAIRLV